MRNTLLMRKQQKMANSIVGLLTLTSLLAVVLSESGENCFFENENGTCLRLQDCPDLVDEIMKAKKPMPSYLRKKLLARGCGFLKTDPLVCCTTGNASLLNPTTGSPTVCCALGNGSMVNVTTEPSNVQNNTNIPVAFKSNNQEVNIMKHPNFNLLPVSCGLKFGNKVFGGEEAKLFEMPWMVLLVYSTVRGIQLNCGGTLITDQYVLTAAHCVTNLSNTTKLIGVVVGEYDIVNDPDCIVDKEGTKLCAPKPQNLTIESVIPHSEYSSTTYQNDIALVRLTDYVDFLQVAAAPICLPYTPELQTEELEGVNSTVAGWGVTESWYSSSVLLQVQLPVLPNSACDKALNRTTVPEKQICAGGTAGKDSCAGDSGGPLLFSGRVGNYGIRKVQRGIVSYGYRECGTEAYPAVYTRVSFYMEWILDNIRS